MNIKTTLATLIATTLAAGGFAIAQTNPPSSTPGAGCTATANAMRGGNLGGSPSNIDCAAAGSANTAAAATGTTKAEAAPAASTGTSAMGNSAAKPAKPMRVAKSDRN
jgi:hypothetical protein